MNWYKQSQAKTLFLLRGVSGSGKSTLGQQLAGAGGIILGADDFWGPDYDFDESRIGEAHQWNQDRVREAMEKPISLIVVDNTNTRFWEMKPYVQLAQEYGYQVKFAEPDTPWKFDAEELAKRNKHNVPQDRIEQMIADWEKDPTPEAILRSKSPYEED